MTKGKIRSYGKRSKELASAPTRVTPVEVEYSGLQAAYEHFNAALFAKVLPDVFITYQRKANSVGYFSPFRFSGRDGPLPFANCHELALNPDAFIGQTDEQVLQTLVHEMVHAWQHDCGTPAARGYHNKEWAAKMKSIGLMPSNTGMVGGKETGARMSDYIIPGGAFSQAYAKLAAVGWKLNLQSAPRQGPKGTANSKTKFTCQGCGQNAWGKPDLEIVCKPCGIQMLGPMAEAPAVEPEPADSEPAPIKRQRGRPKGSKNKPGRVETYEQQSSL